MIDSGINPISTPLIDSVQGGTAGTKKVQPQGASFGKLLDKSIQTVSRMQHEADAKASKLVTGESKDIHNTMISMQKAEIGMGLMIEVRNKLIAAYDEIKRMQF